MMKIRTGLAALLLPCQFRHANAFGSQVKGQYIAHGASETVQAQHATKDRRQLMR